MLWALHWGQAYYNLGYFQWHFSRQYHVKALEHFSALLNKTYPSLYFLASLAGSGSKVAYVKVLKVF